MIPILLATAAGGMIAKNMTDYPAEIRNLRRQIPKDERADFLKDYKSLPKETKAQFKQYLRDANLVEASKLIGRDLSGYAVNVKGKVTKGIASPAQTPAAEAVTDNGFSERIKNILNSCTLDCDPQLLAEAAKRYESISGLNEMNIVDKTRKLLDVSQ